MANVLVALALLLLMSAILAFCIAMALGMPFWILAWLGIGDVDTFMPIVWKIGLAIVSIVYILCAGLILYKYFFLDITPELPF